MKKDKEYAPITIDSFRVAEQDLFEVIVSTEKLMCSYGISSLEFISDVFSRTVPLEQLDCVTDALGMIKSQLEKEWQAQQLQETPQFNVINVRWIIPLTVSEKQLDIVISKIYNEGIGDWAVISPMNQCAGQEVTLPFKVVDIETNQEFTVTKEKILFGLKCALLDFPYVLSTYNGYNLNAMQLSCEDLDEIIQVALFGEIKYEFN